MISAYFLRSELKIRLTLGQGKSVFLEENANRKTGIFGKTWPERLLRKPESICQVADFLECFRLYDLRRDLI